MLEYGMGQFKAIEWRSRFASGIARAEDREGIYRAFLPDLLRDRSFVFESAVAADVADAERAVTAFDLQARSLADTEGLARILLRAESVASSRIEGLIVSPQRLLRADAALGESERPNDATALEVLANIDAMAFSMSGDAVSITVPRLLAIHERMLAHSPLRAEAGKIRTVQNWIGGTRFNPLQAAYVPPPPEQLEDLLEDLCKFCNSDGLPAIAQAAIAHAQFETIHPFADGNGRVGRALIYMVLKQRRLITRTLPPVSLVLATRASEYVSALQSTRFEGTPTDPKASASVNKWIGLFAASTTQAVIEVGAFEIRIQKIKETWRTRLPNLRSDSSALRLVDILLSTPILTPKSAAAHLNVSFEAANNAIAILESANILKNVRTGRRNRAFEATDIIAAFTDLERRMASPEFDTSIAEPNRLTPSRGNTFPTY